METSILERVHDLYFIGIGGSGMCPLVEMLYAGGYAISGSDNNESDNLARLRKLGITVFMGHNAANITGAELVIYTNAVGESNPELVAARSAGIPTMERAELLGLITRKYSNTVAVAGTHGKTTTTSMLSQILLMADKDPSIFIGGKLPYIQANGRAGHSDTMVCEACEFKDHYLKMTPAVAVILNIDNDHLDYFGDLEGVKRSFRNFADKVTGVLIINADDKNTVDALGDVTHVPVVRCGKGGDWEPKNIEMVRGYGRYDLFREGTFFAAVTLGVPGIHNVQNSVEAAAAAYVCGATAEQIAEGIAAFHGSGRRFEFLGTVSGVTVVDDYAHHPTEIGSTLRAARELGYKRVWAVFQPFTYSRTAEHLQEFADALSLADVAVVSEIMGSRETNEWNVHSTQITERMTTGIYIPDFEGIAAYVAAHAAPDDLVLTMGGGDVYKCARMILKKLAEKPQ